jgi:hypothetical protein
MVADNILYRRLFGVVACWSCCIASCSRKLANCLLVGIVYAPWYFRWLLISCAIFGVLKSLPICASLVLPVSVLISMYLVLRSCGVCVAFGFGCR